MAFVSDPNYQQLRARETAVVRVNNADFFDWESVYVEHGWREPWPIFRFTCAEDSPVPVAWPKLQFKPGDECAIYLGGFLAVAGVILARQTAYAAEAHGVMLQGYGITWYAARGSHIDKDGNFDGMTYKQIVGRVLAPFGIAPKFIGNINETPFKNAQISPGETIWDFFERLGRDVGVIVGSNQFGEMLFIGDHAGFATSRLVEGENILRCQATISVENWFSEYFVRSQQGGSDETHGTAASEQEAVAPGRAQRYSPLLTPSEQPVESGMLQLRADNEAKWHDGTVIQVSITVQGWFRPDGLALWAPGEDVSVFSPSAMLDMILKIDKVIFSQDRNQGTLTVLQLTAPWLLNDRSEFNVGNPNIPPAPKTGSINTDPATIPQALAPAEPPANTLEPLEGVG